MARTKHTARTLVKSGKQQNTTRAQRGREKGHGNNLTIQHSSAKTEGSCRDGEHHVYMVRRFVWRSRPGQRYLVPRHSRKRDWMRRYLRRARHLAMAVALMCRGVVLYCTQSQQIASRRCLTAGPCLRSEPRPARAGSTQKQHRNHKIMGCMCTVLWIVHTAR